MFEVLVLLFFIVLSIGHIWGNDGPQALFTLEPFTGVANSLGPIATVRPWPRTCSSASMLSPR